MKQKITISVFVFMVLAGLWATAGHYLAPLPTAEMLETMTIVPGPEWFLQQMPLYERHALLTALHLVPSFIFVLLILLQLNGRLRRRYPQFHRWNGRLFLLLGFFIGISGVVLGIIMPFGGRLETVAVLIMGTGFLYSLMMGLVRIRQGRIPEHRFWMLHMTALGFAPLTMRLFLGFAMYTTDFTGPELFGPTLLLGMLVNLLLLHRVVLKSVTHKRALSTSEVSRVQEF